MNIYIYGSKGFRKDVHEELDHSNIKFRLDDSSTIVELNHLDDLKRAIEINSDDIFLIDDAKILKKDGIHTKFKFLKPKDAIEDSFLFDHGIGDISFDSIEELSKHIITKIEADSTEEKDDRDEIQDSIANIVQEAFDNDKELEEDSIELDEELSQLLASDESIQEDFTPPPLDEDFFEQEKEEDVPLQTFADIIKAQEKDSIEENSFAMDELANGLQGFDIDNEDFNASVEDESKEESIPMDEMESALDGLDISNTDFMGENTQNLDEFTKVDVQTHNVQDIQGDFKMAEDISSLDQISENDIMAALNGEEITLSENTVLTSTENTDSKENMTLSLDSADDISALLAQLLKNKTLEITVKVKD